ncbi:cytochrome P450 [Actinoallomurus rhizosphaericola]|uniref:cytochrome P450 n=1 Tax=Actinoallomurus rhizosphaericola TaxID=2952536 RepID=UPI0020934D2A|nr:cytochrome P450 [Actinoallomurus rhizosphaericola]MCO5999360.1 cytochrome P450 [Actinoallomurus rhizosphaericola]
MAPMSVFEQIFDPANRADPYPLYAELRATPVSRQEDGTYVVSGYDEIVALLHDPRVSSTRRNVPRPGEPGSEEATAVLPPSFINTDPPEHDRLRRLTMRHFGPPHSPRLVESLRPEMLRAVTELIDGVASRARIDVVDDIAYPFPVTVICRILGVPREDEASFHEWADAVVESLDPREEGRAERQRRRQTAVVELHRYLGGIIDERRGNPGDDLLSGLVTDEGPEGPMSPVEVVATATLLLIAGHETTVNLITNGMLTLLRHPALLDRLRREPALAVSMVEELLRYEPPVHFLSSRVALDDIEIGGTTIPKGAPIAVALAAGSRDPAHVPDPDRFDPDRRYNEHLGFGGGIHYCFGAPLARLETQIALTELARRLDNPRLVADPPPYRPSAELRGPRHLLVDVDGVTA